MLSFRVGFQESPPEVRARIDALFTQVKSQYRDVVTTDDQITLDDVSLSYVVGELHFYYLSERERDSIADAFEVFIGPSLKGSQGQFFTPKNVVKLLVAMIDLSSGDKVIDPASGSGGFLVESLRRIWRKLDAHDRELG